ncbi:uncharacterized protein LOC118361792 isoform X3 [Oncorhynchus keta]|uniref:uncharacterized protein LOC118361792 isoform X3 n=1 Tax=Oncorhynchus keta TaxID=8018 RepID=UPI00227C53FF|nr:uncharacterized protein LOC118361792 isoform X3 [Oncorhynchus keta]
MLVDSQPDTQELDQNPRGHGLIQPESEAKLHVRADGGEVFCPIMWHTRTHTSRKHSVVCTGTMTTCPPQPAKIKAHDHDVNTVAFADSSSQLLFSGSDDTLCKVWDRLTLREDRPKPVGQLSGHRDCITFIHSKGDARYLISNSKGPVHQAVGYEEVLPNGGPGGLAAEYRPAGLGVPLAAGCPEWCWGGHGFVVHLYWVLVEITFRLASGPETQSNPTVIYSRLLSENLIFAILSIDDMGIQYV